MPQPTFSWEEVAKHNTADDLWVSHNNKVSPSPDLFTMTSLP